MIDRPVERLPSFIIIGAIKAATTWIAHQLRQHPGIFLPGPEPHYFSTEFERGLQWYTGLFRTAGAAKMIGEKSADYLSHPLAARRIAEMLPAARLIVQLRNPVDRAYSDYCMLYRRGSVSSDPARYLSPKTSENRRFLENGRYATHIARYLDSFPQQQLAIILHDDVRAMPEQTLREVCAHIGIEPMIISENLIVRKNDSETPLLPLGVRRVARPFKHLARRHRNQQWFQAIRGALARPVEYPPLSDDLRARLYDFYQPELETLQKMIGRDLTCWTQGTAAATMPR
ncbi:sulfotransferase [Sphingomonas sp. LaA6.9]|uniref:sulfotransferase family protein n=1 Tax=Sphingomonas sp. LaA6.9 TaxID=2919914 RepID=UPI001F4F793C|nr:sulfotransferase [Sphingomonas sp. LaA6.9]MCJ8158791.1 sulfotransferase domain-containing protein [Sphingomonas sp. LaA6.9]